MPVSLLEQLLDAAQPWCDLRPALQLYRATVILPKIPQDQAAAKFDAALESVLNGCEETR
jgi:hypothetical protein